MAWFNRSRHTEQSQASVVDFSKTMETLVASYKAAIDAQQQHIATLRAENERLSKLLATIADDKFFAANTASKAVASVDVQTATPFTAEDYHYEVEPPSPELIAAMEGEEESGDEFEAEIARLQNAHDKFLAKSSN